MMMVRFIDRTRASGSIVGTKERTMSDGQLRGYALSIHQATGVTDPATLQRIEETMRHTIFHSTLDWQDKETFDKGAREAYGIVRINARGKSPLILPEDA